MPRCSRQLGVRDPQSLLLLPLLARAHRHSAILRTMSVDTSNVLAYESRLAPRAARELVQNACDAIRARRPYEKRDPRYGRITVGLLTDDEGQAWLQVEDNGIGMSQRVLTEFLLDFGRSFWASPELQEELPGLLASGVKATGRYGIGFFSVFMVADRVEVLTRRPDFASRETLALEFSSGLDGRPTLRQARRSEQLIDGGTRVRLKLLRNPAERSGLLYRSSQQPAFTLSELCRRICPAIDVDLYVLESGKDELVIGANDWISGPPVQLLSRMDPTMDSQESTEQEIASFREKAAPNLRLLEDQNGRIFGRAYITRGYAFYDGSRVTDLEGLVTVGGLRATKMIGITGIFTGHPTRASRDSALPSAPPYVLRKWASEQADLIPRLWPDPNVQLVCAQYVYTLGGDTRRLPVAVFRGRFWPADELSSIADPPDVAIFIDSHTESQLKLLKSYEICDSVFITRSSIMSIIQDTPGLWPFEYVEREPAWGSAESQPRRWWLKHTLDGLIIRMLATAWGTTLKAVLAANTFETKSEVVIAKEGVREIKMPAMQVTRPKTTSESIPIAP